MKSSENYNMAFSAFKAHFNPVAVENKDGNYEGRFPDDTSIAFQCTKLEDFSVSGFNKENALEGLFNFVNNQPDVSLKVQINEDLDYVYTVRDGQPALCGGGFKM